MIIPHTHLFLVHWYKNILCRICLASCTFVRTKRSFAFKSNLPTSVKLGKIHSQLVFLKSIIILNYIDGKYISLDYCYIIAMKLWGSFLFKINFSLKSCYSLVLFVLLVFYMILNELTTFPLVNCCHSLSQFNWSYFPCFLALSWNLCFCHF